MPKEPYEYFHTPNSINLSNVQEFLDEHDDGLGTFVERALEICQKSPLLCVNRAL